MKLTPPLLFALPLALSLPVAYADEAEPESQADTAPETQTQNQPQPQPEPQSQPQPQTQSQPQAQSQPQPQPQRQTDTQPPPAAVEQSDVSGWYMGAFFSTQEQDWGESTREFEAAGGLLGYRINRFWALEARLATGTSGYSSHYPHIKGSRDGDYKEEIDQQQALLVKAFVPITDNLSLYGLVGAARTTLEVSGIAQLNSKDGKPLGHYRFVNSFDNEDMTYGGGFNYTIKGKVELFAEYQVLPNFEPDTRVSSPNEISVDWESLNAGINYRF